MELAGTLDAIDARINELIAEAVVRDALRSWPNELLNHEDGDRDGCDLRAEVMRTALRSYREEFSAGRPGEATFRVKAAALRLLDAAY